VHLPPIAPHEARLQAALHAAHVWLAFLLFGIILLHVAAALFHGLVRRDGVFSAMAPWRPWRGPAPQPGAQRQGAALRR
jgi:cytochrome b561